MTETTKEDTAPSQPKTAGALAALANEVRDVVARAEEEVRQQNRQRFLALRAQIQEAIVQGTPLEQFAYEEESSEATAEDARESITLVFKHEFGAGDTCRFVNTVRLHVRPRYIGFATRVDYLALPDPGYRGLFPVAQGWDREGDYSLHDAIVWVVETACRLIRETAACFGLSPDGMYPQGATEWLEKANQFQGHVRANIS